MAKSPDRERHDSGEFSFSQGFFCPANRLSQTVCFADSSSGDYSGGEGGDIQSTPERERARTTQMVLQSDTSSTGSARETPPQQRQMHRSTR